jgi:hypothetical protein
MATLHLTDIQLFNALKQKLGEAEAEQLVGYVKDSVKQEVSEQVPNIATKDFVEAKIATVEAKIQKQSFKLFCGHLYFG